MVDTFVPPFWRLHILHDTMEKLELKHIAPYLPYGLKTIIKGGVWNDTEYLFHELVGLDYSNNQVNMKSNTGVSMWYKFGKHTPILRPLSDLVVEIEVNGKKFIPMVKLAEIADLDITDYSLTNTDIAVGIRCNIESDEDSDIYEVLGFDIINGFGHHYRPSNTWTIVQGQFELWEKLYEWHFDVFGLIDKGLAIDINKAKEVSNG